MQTFVKVVLWVIGISFGVLALLIAVIAFSVFVYKPAKHAWNIRQMDAKIDQTWEDIIAHVVTVEAELVTEAGTETIRGEVVCYDIYFAKPWGLEDGGPYTGTRTKTLDGAALQTLLPDGNTLDLSLRNICAVPYRSGVYRTNNPIELPLKFDQGAATLMSPKLLSNCTMRDSTRTTGYPFEAETVQLGYPNVVEIKTKPLRDLTTRADIGSSEYNPYTNSFRSRWEKFKKESENSGQALEACLGDHSQHCKKTMKQFCDPFSQ